MTILWNVLKQNQVKTKNQQLQTTHEANSSELLEAKHHQNIFSPDEFSCVSSYFDLKIGFKFHFQLVEKK